MKTTIRYGLWESNSSTSHSMIILPKNVYEKWELDDTLFVYDGWSGREGVSRNTLYTFEEVKKILIDTFNWREIYFERSEDENEEDFKYELFREMRDCGFCTYDSWNDSDEMEETETDYETEHGDEIVIRCKFGWDG